MSKIDVSIIFVVKNGAETLKFALDALLLQKKISYEIILVDGGSSDETHKIFMSFPFKFKKYIDNRNELNIVDSYRRGFDLSKGSLILTLGHDDIIFNTEWLSECKLHLDARPDISLISGRTLSINSKFEPYALNPPYKSVIFDDLYSHLGVVLTQRVPNDTNAVIRREVFDLCFPMPSDCLTAITIPHHYFYFNFFRNNFKFLFVPLIANQSIDMRNNGTRRTVKYKSIENKARFITNFKITMLLFFDLKKINKKLSLILIVKYIIFLILNNLSKILKRYLPTK